MAQGTPGAEAGESEEERTGAPPREEGSRGRRGNPGARLLSNLYAR